MPVCTFFGHRDAPESARAALRTAVEQLILQEGVDLFYVGDKGAFDRMAAGVLKEMKEKHPHIDYVVVLAYLPGARTPCAPEHPTLYPEGLEHTPPRFAISRRNLWMMEQARFALVYVRRPGSARDLMEKAQKKGVKVVNLAKEK